MNNLAMLGLALTAASLSATSATAQITYTKGHSDIGVVIDGDELFLHYHFDGSAVLNGVDDPNESEHEPEDIHTILSQPPVLRPAGAEWDFIGTAADQPVWLIWQVQSYQPDNPWLGFGTEEIEPGSINGPVRYELSNITGPGNFAIYAEGVFGEPLVEVSSINSDLTFEIPDGTHAHYNMSFTAPGVYTVDMTASLEHMSLGTLSDTATFTFLVGVPEPASAAMVALASALGFGARRLRC